MKNSGLTLGLAFAAMSFLLACEETSTSPMAADGPGPQFGHKPNHDPGGGGGKEPDCQIRFDLTLDDTNPVSSDGLGTYQDGVDRVSVGTGSGDGFRFDTNGSQKIEANNDIRHVILDFAATDYPNTGGPNELKGADLRFVGNEDGTRLDLCSLATVGASGEVPIILAFLASDLEFSPSQGANASLRYGGIDRLGNECLADKITVTRTASVAEGDLVDEWSLVSGATACLNHPDVPVGTQVPMPIAFTIMAQP